MKITFEDSGNWVKTLRFLDSNRHLSSKARSLLYEAAEKGLSALQTTTPKYTGLASSSWSYEIDVGVNNSTITWINNDIEGGYNVVLLVQYGHGVDGGGYISGVDFINPAIRPIFENFASTLWEEVISA